MHDHGSHHFTQEVRDGICLSFRSKLSAPRHEVVPGRQTLDVAVGLHLRVHIYIYIYRRLRTERTKGRLKGLNMTYMVLQKTFCSKLGHISPNL